MLLRKKSLVLKVVTGVSSGVAIISILLATLCFNSKEYYHQEPSGIKFGMLLNLIEQETLAWARAPGKLFIKSTFDNIMKVEKNGEKTEQSIVSFMPIGMAVNGSMDIRFQIERADKSDFPDLDSVRSKMIPMCYYREKNSLLENSLRYALLTTSMLLNHWTAFNIVGVLFGLCSILLGIVFRCRNRNKTSSSDKLTK